MIVSRQNRWVKDMRRSRRCKGDTALLEGPHLVAEAAAAGVPLAVVLASPEFLESAAGRRLQSLLPLAPLPIDAKLLAGLTDSDSPRGVAALARLPRRRLEALPAPAAGRWVLAEALQDPGNLGALARAAEAAGVRGLALTRGSVDPRHPRALRASAGSLLRLPVAAGVTAAELLGHLEPAHPRLLALVPRGGLPLAELERRLAAESAGGGGAAAGELAGRALIVAVGAEGAGLSSELRDLADLEVSLELESPVESLNVAVAAALALFGLRRAAGA